MRLGPTELAIVLVIVLIIFGPGKLPQVGRSIGKAIGEFRRGSALQDDGEEVQNSKS